LELIIASRSLIIYTVVLESRNKDVFDEIRGSTENTI